MAKTMADPIQLLQAFVWDWTTSIAEEYEIISSSGRLNVPLVTYVLSQLVKQNNPFFQSLTMMYLALGLQVILYVRLRSKVDTIMPLRHLNTNSVFVIRCGLEVGSPHRKFVHLNALIRVFEVGIT
jgi:hypothetical protein